MSIRNLGFLFHPRSVAVIGASPRPCSVGNTVFRNMNAGRFDGLVFPVNPKYREIEGRQAYAKVSDLPAVPDLAVICTPPRTVPGLISELGRHGTRAAIVITAGLGAMSEREDKNLRQAMLDAARPHLLRILGSNCVGLLIPGIGLNASFAHTDALPGRVAFVSQSGALMTGVLDWAKSRGIGFSKFVSIGDSDDVDFADVIDYLAGDPDTHAILLYIEAIRHARKFMSAARAAARNKHVIVVKAGRAPEGAKAAASHTGALAGSDDVYDAAIRRAGMLRVLTTEDLFDAVETLARARPLHGEHLTIMTNGGGPGVMATDTLTGTHGKLAALSSATMAELDTILPATWSHGNPVDIIGDAPAERYVRTMEALFRDPQSDALLLIHAPTAIVPSADIARSVMPLVEKAGRNVLACWLGGEAVNEARRIFSGAGIPTYDTPEDAVQGFMQIVQYRKNQDLLTEVPPASSDFDPDRKHVKEIVQGALAAGNLVLSEADAKAVLAAYGIPVAETKVAATIEDAVQAAQEIGFPVALKIFSPDITHKSDVGGVALDLDKADAVRQAAIAMHERISRAQPDARLDGFTVQTMVHRPAARELIAGIATDPTFGPVILFGQGGIAVEVVADRSVGLPPLNMVLARDMISHTRVSKLLGSYRDQPAADIDEICRTLIRLSQLAADIPEVLELDINPLLADSGGVIALDARIRVAAATAPSNLDHLAIRPYPREWEERISWDGKPLLLRPIRPEDGNAHAAFYEALNEEDMRYRMFIGLRRLQPSQLARLTQIDYDREMAFVAIRQQDGGACEMLGVAHAMADPDNVVAEFSIVVRSDLKGRGLGRILMEKLIRYCRTKGTQRLEGETLIGNQRLLGLAKALNFQAHWKEGNETVSLTLNLDQGISEITEGQCTP